MKGTVKDIYTFNIWDVELIQHGWVRRSIKKLIKLLTETQEYNYE